MKKWLIFNHNRYKKQTCKYIYIYLSIWLLTSISLSFCIREEMRWLSFPSVVFCKDNAFNLKKNKWFLILSLSRLDNESFLLVNMNMHKLPSNTFRFCAFRIQFYNAIPKRKRWFDCNILDPVPSEGISNGQVGTTQKIQELADPQAHPQANIFTALVPAWVSCPVKPAQTHPCKAGHLFLCSDIFLLFTFIVVVHPCLSLSSYCNKASPKRNRVYSMRS